MTYTPGYMLLGKRCLLCNTIVSPYVIKQCECSNNVKAVEKEIGVPGYSWKSKAPLKEYADVPKTTLSASEKTVVVGDTHGNYALLDSVLQSAGVISANGKRKDDVKRLIHIGDLIDGRNREGDLLSVQSGEKYFDELVIGNHEAAYMGGTSFIGEEPLEMETRLLINRLEREGKFVAATNIGEWLLVHGGVAPQVMKQLPDAPNANTIAENLNELWRFGHDGIKERVFNSVSGVRLGSSSYGGVMWCDFRELIRDEDQLTVPQIIGHTPWPQATFSPKGSVLNLDVGGMAPKAVSAAVIDEKGVTMHIAYAE